MSRGGDSSASPNCPAVSGHAQRGETCAAAEQRAPRAEIAGLLHPDSVALVQENARGKVQGRLGAGYDDDPLRGAIDAPRDAEILRYGLAQAEMSGEVIVAEEILASPLRVAREKPCPGREWEAW